MASAHVGNRAEGPRFIADCHLGKVAKYLRFMGYDTLFFPAIDDSELILRAQEEERTVLTRDALLSRRKNVPVYFLRAIDPAEQLQELSNAFALRIRGDGQRRCMICNALLDVIGKAEASDAVPEKVTSRFDFFQRCPECGRIYWHGDHYRNMMAFLNDALAHGV